MQYQKSGYLNALRVIHLALLATQCIMLAIVVYLVIQKAMPAADKSLDKLLQVVALVVSFVGVYGAIVIVKKKLAVINAPGNSLAVKANQYRMINIVQWAMLEGASLFVMICFLLTANFAFGALAVALIVFFILLAPTKLKIMLQLQLNDYEANSLQ